MEVDVPETQDPCDDVVARIQLASPLLAKAAVNFDNRYISKVFKDLSALRALLRSQPDALARAVAAAYPAAADPAAFATALGVPIAFSAQDPPLPEVELYLHLLVQVFLLDSGLLDRLNAFNTHVLALMNSYNRRSLDLLQAKIWFYVARCHELQHNLVPLRPAMLSSLRNATLRHDSETTAALITLLLRNYLLSHDVAMASNLVQKAPFPEDASSAVAARYYFYLARIHAVQLDYSSAHECIIAAIRKAPQTRVANGFVQIATKLSIVVQLLMGDIPELSVFRKQAGNFEPYYYISRAVRLGDLNLFGTVLAQYKLAFVADDTFTLVSRLRQNVIKTGIRIISLLYSKISLKDICIKLHLDLEELTEYIVSKAIRDGVIEASINHERGYMHSKQLRDVYASHLPQQEFDQRIRFCLALHTDAIKSMRYPRDANNSPSKVALARESELDLLKIIEEGDLDDFLD